MENTKIVPFHLDQEKIVFRENKKIKYLIFFDSCGKQKSNWFYFNVTCKGDSDIGIVKFRYIEEEEKEKEERKIIFLNDKL